MNIEEYEKELDKIINASIPYEMKIIRLMKLQTELLIKILDYKMYQSGAYKSYNYGPEGGR